MRTAIIRLFIAINPYLMAFLPIKGGERSFNWPLLVNQFFDWFTPKRQPAPVPVAIYVGDTFDISPPPVGFVVDTELPGPMPEPLPAPETVDDDVRVLPMTPAPAMYQFTYKGERHETADPMHCTKPMLVEWGAQLGLNIKKHWKKEQMVSVLLGKLKAAA